MTDFDPFNDWLHDLSYLEYEQTETLPAWKRTIALVQQFLVVHLNDGAGSLFYNDPEKVHPVAVALGAIDEVELSTLVAKVAEALLPGLREVTADSQRFVLQEVSREPLASLVKSLDQLIEDRWIDLHDKMMALAEANDWRRTQI